MVSEFHAGILTAASEGRKTGRPRRDGIVFRKHGPTRYAGVGPRTRSLEAAEAHARKERGSGGTRTPSRRGSSGIRNARQRRRYRDRKWRSVSFLPMPL